jgi:[lysine-biosynthesis-protein LysW]--L-2-aminoadipate ligase
VNKVRVGVLLSRVRVEEKLLLAELESRGVETKVIDDRELVLAVEQRPELGVDVILERCIQHGTALYALSVFDAWGVPTVNRYEVAEICGNKLLTTMRLIRDGVPSPRTRVAFTPESALTAIEELGYPVVLKPLIGSWGRLISKVNDREAAEAIVEHKDVLGNYLHSIYYIQEYIQKPGRDIRAFVVGGETIAAPASIGSRTPLAADRPRTVRSRPRSTTSQCAPHVPSAGASSRSIFSRLRRDSWSTR